VSCEKRVGEERPRLYIEHGELASPGEKLDLLINKKKKKQVAGVFYDQAGGVVW
jgi:hypothetical protein